MVKSHDVDHRRGKAELDNNVPEGEVTLTLGAKFLHAGVQVQLASTSMVTSVK
jgi:hypothetical protein